jgi:hypothetical protein
VVLMIKKTCTLFIICFFWLSLSVSADPFKHQELWIYINLWSQRLYVLEGNQIKAEFIVGIGKERTPTPIGEWKVVEKSQNWDGGFGPNWLGLNVPWGKYGIHGTNKPGSVGHKASHGCLRMLNTDIGKLYKMIPVGTRVKIEGPVVGFDEWKLKKLVRGDRGTLIVLVQNRLAAAGYYHGSSDGIFGAELERSIIRFQKEHRLKMTGQINFTEYVELGLLE